MILLRAPRSVGATIAALVLVLAGCSDEPVRTYRTSKEPLPPAIDEDHSGHDHGTTATGELPAGHPPIGDTALAPAGGAAAPAAGTDSLTWTAPDHWAAKPLGAMRRGSFTAKNAAGEADCSLFVFPAATNPLLDNINRWRNQVALPPLTEAQLAAETTTLANPAGLQFVVVELLGQTGAGATRVLGAVHYRGDEAWFVKLSGPDAVVAAEKAAFLDFLHTVRPAAS